MVATKLDTGRTDLSGSFSSSRFAPTGKGDVNGTTEASCPWQSVQLAFVSRDIVTQREVSYKASCIPARSAVSRACNRHQQTTRRHDALRCIISRNWERRVGRSCRRKLNEQTLARDKRDDIRPRLTRCETTLRARDTIPCFLLHCSLFPGSQCPGIFRKTPPLHILIPLKSFMKLLCDVNMIYICRLHTFACIRDFDLAFLHICHVFFIFVTTISRFYIVNIGWLLLHRKVHARFHCALFFFHKNCNCWFQYVHTRCACVFLGQ